MAVSANSQLVTARLPCDVMAEVRRIADAEAESASTVLRRLLRVWLSAERQPAAQLEQ